MSDNKSQSPFRVEPTQERVDPGIKQAEAINVQRVNELERVAIKGEQMQAWLDTQFKYFEDNILTPVEMEMFKFVKSEKYDPGDLSQAHQVKATVQVASVLRGRMKSIIEAGKQARIELNQIYSTLENRDAK